MNKYKQHWAVIKASHLNVPALVVIDDENPGTIYWNGGPSHMTRAKYDILDEAHIDSSVSEQLKKIDDLELRMYQDFYDYAPLTEPQRTAGWISPDGVVYPCEYAEHISKASVIVAKVYGELKYNNEKFLEDNGWLKLYGDGVVVSGNWDFKCTQEQIDAMGWLCNAPDATPEWLERVQQAIEIYKVE